MTWKSKCDDPKCPGWAVFNETAIQCCDACGRFADDREAFEHILTTAMVSWEICSTRFIGCDGVELVRAHKSEDCETIAVFRGRQFVKTLSYEEVPRTFREWLQCARYSISLEREEAK